LQKEVGLGGNLFIVTSSGIEARKLLNADIEIYEVCLIIAGFVVEILSVINNIAQVVNQDVKTIMIIMDA